jgi:TolB protein
MGGEPKLITTTGHNPDWSPSGEELAYATNEGDGRILLVNPDGDVHKAVGLPYSSYPHWSPDGTRIAFTADGVGSENLYVLFLSDMTEGLVGHNDTGFMQWSPDGERIAFTAGSGDKKNLYISEVSDFPGSIGEAQIVTVDGSVSYPAWSPDGTAIAFVSRDQGNRNIYIASFDCFNQPMPCVDNIQLITNSPDTETSPIWFPDGDHITYIAGAGSSWRIELIDLESGETQVLIGDLYSPRQLDGHGW